MSKCVRRRSALTLLELIVVLFVLVLLAGIVVPLVSGTRSQAEDTATRQTLANVRDAVIQYWMDAPKRLPRREDDDTTGREPGPQVVFLFVNPATWDVVPAGYEAVSSFDPNYQVGWRGPYLSQATGRYRLDSAAGFTPDYGVAGADPDQAALDAWGNPVVLQNPTLGLPGVQDVRVVSAGPNGRIDINPTTLSANLTDVNDGDDLYVAFTLR